MTCPLGLRRALGVPSSRFPLATTILMGSDGHLHLACLIDVNSAHLYPQSFPPSQLAPPSVSSNRMGQRLDGLNEH